MSRTVYALFVGIDQYAGPINNLNGCVNDVTRIEQMFAERISGANDTFAPLSLHSQQATRQAIVDGFRKHLSQAGPDDVALFYYCGHGAQQHSPQPFWFLEPDRLDETIVCHDSRIKGGWDLADKELAQLFAEIAQNEAHVLSIFDSCHSGSITRGEIGDVRLTEVDKRERPIDTYLVSPENAKALLQAESEAETEAERMQRGWFKLPRGRHIAFSACRAEELAKEKRFGNEKRGVFSYFLQEALTQSNSILTYRDLFTRVNARVRSNVSQQLPWLEATDPRELDQPFLGGAIQARNPFFVVGYDAKARAWKMDGGALHSIPAGQEQGATTLALFPFDAPAEALRNSDSAVGTATVRSVQATESNVDVQLTDGEGPAQTDQYKAVVSSIAIEPLGVIFEGDAAALDLVREALQTANPSGGPSFYVVESEGEDNDVQLRLLAQENRYQILRTADTYAMAVSEDGYSAESASLVVARLEHIERWLRAFNLSNPNSRLPENAIQLDVEHVLEDGDYETVADLTDVRFVYAARDGEWVEPELMLKLTNTTQKTLYCALLDLNESYAITSALIPGGIVKLERGESTYANAGEPIVAWIPDELWERGITNLTERLKLIISDQEFVGDRLDQDELDVEFSPRSIDQTRGVEMNTLDQILGEVQTRNLGGSRARKRADWLTREYMFTIVRPQAAVTIPADPAESRSLGGEVSVRIKGHPGLQAEARLTNEAETTRDINGFALPRLLTDHPNVEPFEFTSTRAATPGLNVLNLDVAAGQERVTPEEPLLLETDQLLGANEYILPVGFDGEHYLPLGRMVKREEGTTIAIERLPQPLSEGKRSLTGSIKIYFQKVIGDRFGVGNDYPRLAIAEVSEGGDVSANHDVAHVKSKVAEHERIVLYIHGILGDTNAMAGSARTGWLKLDETPAALAERYDLILTFDYENLNTPLQQTAVDLRKRLEAIGLGAGHGKTLHIVAHSMGGLVSRWFIEREGGNQVVQHLIMLGTPNAGSPWPRVEDWALATLGAGLNGLMIGSWPVHALSSLLAIIENEDNALDEMHEASSFLRALQASHDPGVSYTLIAGNTSIIPAALGEDEERRGLLSRLLEKLNPTGNWLHAATGLAFYGQPNDIAVSVESIFSVPDARDPQPRKLDTVACDHISYFRTAAGLNALAAAT